MKRRILDQRDSVPVPHVRLQFRDKPDVRTSSEEDVSALYVVGIQSEHGSYLEIRILFQFSCINKVHEIRGPVESSDKWRERTFLGSTKSSLATSLGQSREIGIDSNHDAAVLQTTVSKAIPDDIIEQFGSLFSTISTSTDEIVVEDVSIAIHKDQNKWITLLTTCELLVSFPVVSFFLEVALEAFVAL